MVTPISDTIGTIQILLTIIIIVILLFLFLSLDYWKDKRNKPLIWTLIIIFAVLVSLILFMPWFQDPIEPTKGVSIFTLTIYVSLGQSLHLGLVLGFPALILVTIGTILVAYDEPKYVLYHGFYNGSAWILTLINVIWLITLTPQQMTSFSGWLHTAHIGAGGIGLVAGFLSLLFGLSGQRYYAKLSGYVTLGCWWGAFLVGFILPSI